MRRQNGSTVWKAQPCFPASCLWMFLACWSWTDFLLQVYFPPDSLVAAHFTPSSHTTVCPWKGTASYKNVTVDGATNANAAWVYEAPKAAVANIKGHVAFWKGVQVTRS